MLNYVALIILGYLVLGPWKMKGQNVGQTERIPLGLEIPELGSSQISAGILLGILVAVLIFLAYKMCIRDRVRILKCQLLYPKMCFYQD